MNYLGYKGGNCRLYLVKDISGHMVRCSREEFIRFIQEFNCNLVFRNTYEYDRSLPFPRFTHSMMVYSPYMDLIASATFKDGVDHD